jgi:trehalose 6-phosphate synthase/phosphatase
MARVIIVSNRLPVSVKKVDGTLEFSPSVGGVATGLSSYMHDRNNRWLGWPGIASDDLSEAEQKEITVELRKYNCVPIFLTQRQIEDFYNGYSNTILWPFFHNLPVPNPKERERMWRAYRTVNRSFAAATAKLTQSGSQVWVQDYQLLLVPEMLRAFKPSLNIGFFLHIPFPKPQSFSKLPEARRLLIGMLGTDLLGFHTRDYVNNFLDTCEQLHVGQSEHKQVILGARTVRVSDFPMGIDYTKYAQAGREKDVKQAVRKYGKRYRGKKIIVAVERMDPTKGLIERVEAYGMFLERNPRYRRKVVFSLGAAPSRTDVVAYQRLAKNLATLVANINAKYGDKNWQPIDFRDVSTPFHEVAALFQLADIAFITPIRDGMNLVAKEYVASRGRNGILILSQTAGAAQELTDALLIDPKKPETMVAALEQAMKMPKRELRQRFKRMQQQLATNTVQHWATTFMKTLGQPLTGTSAMTYALNDKRRQDLLDDYRLARSRLVLLDYDGTLVPLAENYANAEPPRAIIELLQKLASDSRNTIVLISGRSKADLDQWFGNLPINLIAEHGALVKAAGHKSWQATTDTGTRWKKTVKPVLEAYTELTPRSRVEEKQYSLVWHYRQSPAFAASKNLVIIQRLLKPELRPAKIAMTNGSKILEIKDPRINKGQAIQRWLRERHQFILAIGDDMTDEDMFVRLSRTPYSVKVGSGRTAAHLRLSAPDDVVKLLRQLSR